MQVAIVGLAPSTHDQAPFEDPEWETWGLAQDNESYPYLGRAFEMHPLPFIREVKPLIERRFGAVTKYGEYMTKCEQTKYLIEKHGIEWATENLMEPDHVIGKYKAPGELS